MSLMGLNDDYISVICFRALGLATKLTCIDFFQMDKAIIHLTNPTIQNYVVQGAGRPFNQ
jgi:hypothetical protein